jgi:hypothetical protein
VKLPDISLFKGWPTLQPEFAVAGAPAREMPRERRSNPLAGVMLFASGSGSGGNDDDGYDDDLVYEEPVEQPTRRAPGAQRSAAGASSGGGGRGGAGGGRPRSVQYQPEERYWTEYLRIALPILGLLLMIGLLWFWALQLMDDDEPGGDQPVVTEPAPTQEVVVPDSTPTTEATDEVIAPPTIEPTPTQEQTTPEAPPEETPANTGGGEIAIDSVVQTTEEGVNMRTDASVSADSLGQLPAGTVLTVTDGPIEADDYTWWQVVNDATGEVGYVVDDFLEVAP